VATNFLRASAGESAAGECRRYDQLSRRLAEIEGRMGQRPYDDEVLDMAVTTVNADLVYLGEKMREVARRQLWDELAGAYE